MSQPEPRLGSRFTARLVSSIGLAAIILVAAVFGFYAGRETAPSLTEKNNLKAKNYSPRKLPHAQQLPQMQQSEFSSVEDGTWVVSSDPGPNVPPIGRSLFDHLTTVDDGKGSKKQIIPFPFTKLVTSIQGQVRPESATPGFGIKNVLIPLGRSLQRSASTPDFFRFPRVVIGVDGFPVQQNGATGILLRDRLFIGYNEKASVLEIISYNEVAGRYEFQLAHDYKEGSQAQALYANRSVCLSCHQNATPIFSDRPWQETNAHADITSRMKAAMTVPPGGVGVLQRTGGFDGQNYMGVPLAVPELQPQGIDNAKFRANLIPATHFLWQRLCDAVDGSTEGSAKCRGQLLAIAIRMGLTNQLDDTNPLFFMRDVSDFLSRLASTWKRQWPMGLLISSPRIPNRNPFEKPRNPGPFDVGSLRPDIAGAIGDVIRGSNIPADFEPLNKRPAFDKWDVLTASQSPQDVSGLANWLRQIVAFFTDLDWYQIDQLASAKAITAGNRAQVSGVCNVNSSTSSKVSFTCEGTEPMDPVRLAGFVSWDSAGKASGALETLAVRSTSGCDLTLGAEQGACPEALNLVLRGKVTTTADGVFQATLVATNRINNQRTRFSDGNLLESFTMRWKQGSQVAVAANILRDFSYIEQAFAQAVQDASSGKSNLLAKNPFRRTAVLSYLRQALGGQVSVAGDCCENDKNMPAAKSEEGVSVADDQLTKIIGPAAAFMKECSVCHRNNGGFPVNFLTGSVLDVQKQLSLCAERIWYRINMYNVPLSARGQSPMPPISRLNAMGITELHWQKGESFKNVRNAATELLKSKGIEPQDPKVMNYQSLPACFGNAF